MNREKQREYNRKYYEKNKERIQEQRRNYFAENEEQIKEWRRKYYQEHKEELDKKNREYIRTHKEAVIKSIMESKKRRAERLRQEGVSNPWSVINRGEPKKYYPKIGLIDLETDELVAIFNSYKECAAFFETTTNAIRKNIARSGEREFDGKRYKMIVADRNAS
jgi:exonuclease VII large subunit